MFYLKSEKIQRSFTHYGALDRNDRTFQSNVREYLFHVLPITIGVEIYGESNIFSVCSEFPTVVERHTIGQDEIKRFVYIYVTETLQAQLEIYNKLSGIFVDVVIAFVSPGIEFFRMYTNHTKSWNINVFRQSKERDYVPHDKPSNQVPKNAQQFHISPPSSHKNNFLTVAIGAGENHKYSKKMCDIYYFISLDSITKTPCPESMMLGAFFLHFFTFEIETLFHFADYKTDRQTPGFDRLFVPGSPTVAGVVSHSRGEQVPIIGLEPRRRREMGVSASVAEK
uniref:Uncharacterized protein n=1 Tax=Romanomermis culicivorax TaxID=13658 RepID=A0A915IT59_ROMCU